MEQSLNKLAEAAETVGRSASFHAASKAQSF
jgi:hypothetical protein